MSEYCESKQKIFASIIYSPPRLMTANAELIHKHVKDFTEQLFNQSEIEFHFFPSILTRACRKEFPTKYIGFDKGHGSNIAHKEVWERFYFRRRLCGVEQRDVMLIFEYDAFIGLPEAWSYAIERVRTMNSDLHYLGYCYQKPSYHPSVSGKAPYCLHAYAIQLEGAKKLVELVDTCSFFADAQVAILADSKNISWSYENQSYDKHFVSKYLNDRGIHISGPFLYDGIFVQAKFDRKVTLDEGKLGNNNLRGRQTHISRNFSIAEKALTCVSTYSPRSNSAVNTISIMSKFYSSWIETTKGRSSLLIVDDKSQPEYQDFLVSLTAMLLDRVSILMRPKNGGVSRCKNSCLKVFLDGDYDHLFLADHDIVFKKPGWQEHYISTSSITGIQMFSYFVGNGPKFDFNYSHHIVSNSPWLNGCLLYMTRKVVSSIGGMNVLPQKWGHEHTLYTYRAIIAGYAPFTADVARSEDYLYLGSNDSVFNAAEKRKFADINLKAMKNIMKNLSANLHAPIIE